MIKRGIFLFALVLTVFVFSFTVSAIGLNIISPTQNANINGNNFSLMINFSGIANITFINVGREIFFPLANINKDPAQNSIQFPFNLNINTTTFSNGENHIYVSAGDSSGGNYQAPVLTINVTRPKRTYNLGLFLIDFRNSRSPYSRDQYIDLFNRTIQYWKSSVNEDVNFTLDSYGFITLDRDAPVNASDWVLQNIGIWNQAMQIFNSTYGVTRNNYQKSIFVAAGYGFAEGGGKLDGLGSFFIGSLPDMTQWYLYNFVPHEFGHMLGLGHGNSLIVNESGILKSMSANISTWNPAAYGDIYTLMGTGDGYPNAYELDRLGWEQIPLINSSGIYRIYAIGSVGGYNGYKLFFNTIDRKMAYYIQTRRSIGYDSYDFFEKGDGIIMNFMSNPPPSNGFLLADGSYLIDLSPNDGRGKFSISYPVLHRGNNYTDPWTNITFSVINDSGNYTDFQVSYPNQTGNNQNPYHPADMDHDFAISQSEATAYRNLYLTTPTIPADFATVARSIYLTNPTGTYHYVSGTTCPPSSAGVCWIPG